MEGYENRRRIAWGFVAVAVLAITVRVAAIFAVSSYRLENVTYEHGEIAKNLIEGRGFTMRWLGAEGPTSQQAPVYPTLVAAFYWAFGIETPAALLALQLFQASLGGVLVIALVLWGLEMLPRHSLAVWFGGFGVAFYPTLVYAATQVQVASVVTVVAVMVLWFASRTARTGHVLDAVICGLVSGLLVQTDPIMILVVCVAALRIACGTGPIAFGRPARLAGICLAIAAAVSAPWIFRNYCVHHEFVFVKSTFGYAFWQGNHPQSFGTDKIPLRSSEETDADEAPGWGLRALEKSLWRTRRIDTLYIDDAVLPNERIRQLGMLTEPGRSRELLGEALEYVAENPGHYARLCVQRLRYFLLFDETNPKSRVMVYRIAHGSLQVLALIGLWSSRHDWRRLWPTYFVFAGVTLFHSFTIVSARFHIPLEPIQLLWAGCAGAAVLDAMRGRMRGAMRAVGSHGAIPARTAICSG